MINQPNCIEFLRGARRNMKELCLTYEMHHQDRRVDALGDAVKIKFFVEVGRFAVPRTMCVAPIWRAWAIAAPDSLT
jgi:hypothetical protein